MAEQMSVEEFVDTLTGFDELAIEKTFGAEVMDLLQKSPTKGLRALVFVSVRRSEGLKDTAARERVLGMPLGEVQGWFPEDEPEVTPDEPVTEAGKGDAQPS